MRRARPEGDISGAWDYVLKIIHQRALLAHCMALFLLEGVWLTTDEEKLG